MSLKQDNNSQSSETFKVNNADSLSTPQTNTLFRSTLTEERTQIIASSQRELLNESGSYALMLTSEESQSP